MECLEQASGAHVPRSRPISVAVRLRPPLAGERRRQAHAGRSPAGGGAAWAADRAEPGGLVDRKTGEVWYFDAVCEPEASTGELYEACVHEIVDSFCEGFNGTIFTYGQTASGKTFTMQGDGQVDGVAQLAVQGIFAHILSKPDHQYLVSASYLEVYNERVFDLLSADGAEVELGADQQGSFKLCHHTARHVNSCPEDILSCLADGECRRHKKSQHSSMSHVILQIEMESRQPRLGGECGNVLQSTLNLVDLASSERMATDRSLFDLAEAVTALAAQQHAARPSVAELGDSVLLSMLDKSIGGNSQTAVLCTISPAHADYAQTRRVLDFANRARRVQNKVSANVYPESQSLIHQWEMQISRARAELAALPPQAPFRSSGLQDMREQMEFIRKGEDLERSIKALESLILQAPRLASMAKPAQASPAVEAAGAAIAGAAAAMPISQKRPRARPSGRADPVVASCQLLESAEDVPEANAKAASPQSRCSSAAAGGAGSDAPAAPRKRRRPASVSSGSCGQRAGSREASASAVPCAGSARLRSGSLRRARSASAGPTTAASTPAAAPAAQDPRAAPTVHSAPAHTLVAELVRRLREAMGGGAAPAAEVAEAEPRDLLPLAEEANSLLSAALGSAAAAARPESRPGGSSVEVASPPTSPRSFSPAELFQQRAPPPLPLPAPEPAPEVRELRAGLDAQELRSEELRAGLDAQELRNEELAEALERTRQEFAEAKLQAAFATEEAALAVELAEVHRTCQEAQEETLAAAGHLAPHEAVEDLAAAERLRSAGGLSEAQGRSLPEERIATAGGGRTTAVGRPATQGVADHGSAAVDDGSGGVGLVASRHRSAHRRSVGAPAARSAAPEGFLKHREDHFDRAAPGGRPPAHGRRVGEGEWRSGASGEAPHGAADERSRRELLKAEEAEEAAARLQSEHREAEERARLEALAVSRAERAQRSQQPHHPAAQHQDRTQCGSQRRGHGHGEGEAQQPAPPVQHHLGQAQRPSAAGPARRRPYGARDRDGCQHQ